MHAISFIQDLAVIMLVAGVVTILFHRLKQPNPETPSCR